MDNAESLKIGITGASGFVGQQLVLEILRHGHQAIGFSRHPERPINGCAETRAFVPGGRMDVSGLDAMVNLAGEPIMGRWTSEKKHRILNSRCDGTRTLVDAMLRAAQWGTAPRVLINASAIGYYGETGDLETDETAPPGAGFLAAVTQAWEAEALRAKGEGAEIGGDIRVVIVRFGLILDLENYAGGVTQRLGPLFRAGLGAQLGDGKQWMSWVEVRDVARLILFAIENRGIEGILNATAPTSMRNKEFTQAFARRLHQKAWLVIPKWLLQGLLGELSSVLLDSQRIVPRRTEALGFRFEHREL